MAKKQGINFGHFVRHERERMQLSRSQFIAKAGIQLSERRLWQIEMQMPEPKVQRMKYEAIARALGMDTDELGKKWKATPVARPIDVGRTRGELKDISRWLATEADRLKISRVKAAEMLLKLLGLLGETRRDEYYERPAGDGPAPMRIPGAKKDSRLRPAAKSMGKLNRSKA